ncbi:phage protein D [Bradyrhizobium sp. LB1.3]
MAVSSHVPGEARREGAEQDAEHQRDRERGQRQQQRRRQPLQDQLRHWCLLAEGEAEVERHDALDVDEELLGQRLVEAELLPELLDEDLVTCTGLARHHDRGVAGRKPDQEEIEDDDREQDDHALQGTLSDEGEHC